MDSSNGEKINPLMATYGRLDAQFVRGEGSWLYNESGDRFLDGISGIGVNALGHSHPALVEAITAQAGQLLHTSNIYNIARQTELAESLCRLSGMDNVFFSNSGAEANEAAIKLARLHGHNKGIARPAIVVMENAFHGRTIATLTASGSRKIQAGFEPLLGGFVRVPYGDINALQTIAENSHDVAAVLVEPIQGEGGVNVLPDNFLAQLRELCDSNDWLMMLDEVQTGNGRTGKYFAYQHHDLMPDVVATAKGLGGGVPIGACLAHGKAAALFKPGNHGSTFGGNPLACAAGLAVTKVIDQENLASKAGEDGVFAQSYLREKLAGAANVKDIRGRGLMLGIELTTDCANLVGKALAQGLLINVTAGKVIRLLPPLTIKRDELTHLLDGVCELVLEVSSAQKPLAGAA